MWNYRVRSSPRVAAILSASRTVWCIVGIVLAALPSQAQDAESDDVPLYDSTVDTVFDIIQTSDQSNFACLQYMGRGDRQIWDKRVDNEPTVNAFLFVARYADGTNTEIAINPEYGTKENARNEALRFATPLGQLPTLLRTGIRRFSVHRGEEGFHAGTGQVVVYSGTADERVRDNHLEESLFHEAVHASLDEGHRLAAGWREAQVKDGRFLTGYAQESPEREDLAETALFAYAILKYPDRFPPVDTEDTLRLIPNRFEYIKQFFPPGQPIFSTVRNAEACGADAE